MDAIDRLIAAVDATGLKQNHVARLARMDPTKLNKILKRHQVPTVPEFIDIARAIKMDPARLFTRGEMVVELDSLRSAHDAARRAAEILSGMLPPDVPPAAAPVALPKRGRVARYVTPIGAAADPNAELLVQREEKRRKIPAEAWNLGARMIARAVGDSMDGGDDPIRDGALVYLKPTRSPVTAANRVALVRRDDGLYLKRFEQHGNEIQLVSMNGARPIVIDARGENMQIYGYVVAHD
ncbi:MAG TPA: XRE family transcriptional regulator [Thermoanaerobaculia bacterium]|jgi:SOS-response transcriptional repressor LexA